MFGAVCPELGTGAALVLPACNTEAMQLRLNEIATKVTLGAHAILIFDQAGMARRQRPQSSRQHLAPAAAAALTGACLAVENPIGIPDSFNLVFGRRGRLEAAVPRRERKAYVYRRTFPTRGDKAVRAQSIRGRMALHGLYVPQNASWVAELRSELLSFPAGKFDDQVDALGLIGQLLDTISAGNKPQPAEHPKRDTGYRPYDFGGGRANDWLAY